MPPRTRAPQAEPPPTGDQPGAVHLVESIRADALAALDDIPDLAARALAADEARAAVADLRGDFANVRRAAVRAMKDGDTSAGRKPMSWDEIGKALGVTRGRAQQLAKGE